MATLRSDKRSVAGNIQPILETDVSRYKGFIRSATVDDAIYVSTHIRDEDWDEVMASCGLPAQLAIPYLIENPAGAILASGLLKDNRAEILWGFDEIPGVDDTAIVWLVSTPRVFEHAQLFVPVTRVLFEKAHESYRFMTNFVDERNTKHINWLRWLGFHFIRRVERFGAESRPFLEFISYRD